MYMEKCKGFHYPDPPDSNPVWAMFKKGSRGGAWLWCKNCLKWVGWALCSSNGTAPAVDSDGRCDHYNAAANACLTAEVIEMIAKYKKKRRVRDRLRLYPRRPIAGERVVSLLCITTGVRSLRVTTIILYSPTGMPLANWTTLIHGRSSGAHRDALER